MSLFTDEDIEASEQIQESDWEPPSGEASNQLREDFGSHATTEELEDHEDWKIVNRRDVGITHEDGTHIEDGEVLEVTHPELDFTIEFVPNQT